MATAEKITPVPTKEPPEKPPESRELQPTRAWNPFAEMDRMMERMRERSFGRGWLDPFRFEWPHHELPTPRVDVIDRDTEIVVRAEVPGVAKEDLEVSMSGNTVTFRGSTKREEEKEEGEYHYREMSRGEFSRTVTLPTMVDTTNAKAKYKDGTVELVLPKLETAKRTRIEVEAE